MLSTRIGICSSLLVGSALVLSVEKPTDTPALDDVLARAGQYVSEYGRQMTFVVCTENYSQWVENPGVPHYQIQTLVSDFAIVRIQDDWLGFRDVRQVDGKTVSDQQDRLQKLFLESPGTALHDAREIADESARYNIGAIQRNFNTPTMALFFLQGSTQARFKFRKTGEDTVSGVSVWKVRFDEHQRPTIIRTRQGKDMPLTGTAWIDPTDGRVLKTHMQIESEARLGGVNSAIDENPRPRGSVADTRTRSSASMTVTYKTDTALGLLVPSEMLETYEGPRANALSVADSTTKINCRATYTAFRRFETKANWSVPK